MQNKPTPHSYWRHYKSTGGIDHTYEVIGIARHSELSEHMVVYRPLYIAWNDTKIDKYDFFVRPISEWSSIVNYKGKNTMRFIEI